MTPELRAERDEAIARCLAGIDPGWASEYLGHATVLLQQGQPVEGGLFREWALMCGIRKPRHHNHWVSMVKHMEVIGMIQSLGKVTPTTPGTHINEVHRWRPLI